MLRLAADLPDAAVGLAPVLDRGLHLALEDRPHALVERVARAGVQVDRVQQRAPHVVLLLLVGVVADPHRPGALVAGEVVEHLLVELALAADAVHHLQVLLAAGHVGDEVEEVVGLPVEAERVQRPQHERRVADPAVAVVPVALAVRGLGQRGGGGGEQRAGRGVGQPLERQRAALQERPPRMVGELAAVEPVLPVVGGPDQPLVGLLEAPRWLVLGPRQRAVDLLALLHPVAGLGPGPFEAEAQVGGQPQLDVAPLGAGQALVVAGARVLPLHRARGRSRAPARSRA